MQPRDSLSFREVLVDQPFSGKWLDVDMHFGGGHNAFQGTMYSDSAGGFSYQRTKTSKPIINNRFIYWRTCKDSLELMESSMDYNLVDNQIRYKFQDSPIVGSISLTETESNVIILVTTITSVNRFIFSHPNDTTTLGPGYVRNSAPSIFLQTHQPRNSRNMKSFTICSNAINFPVPITAACFYNLSSDDSIFALSYENDSIMLYKISSNDTLVSYDLRLTSSISRFFSGLSFPLLKSTVQPQNSSDDVMGIQFFSHKLDIHRDTVFMATLSINGELKLSMCFDLDNFTDWRISTSGSVDPSGSLQALDSSIIFRPVRSDGNPKYAVYIPGIGFNLYEVSKSVDFVSGQINPMVLVFQQFINFKEREVIDFCMNESHIFVLLSNSEEEADWKLSHCYYKEGFIDFHQAHLETVPTKVFLEDLVECLQPKAYYFDLIFESSSFSSQTICKALGIFDASTKILPGDDWEQLKCHTLHLIDSEIAKQISGTDCKINEEEFVRFDQKLWELLYNTCVEYHILTLKPLGIFFEESVEMLSIIKKGRISFLRPLDELENKFYAFMLEPNGTGNLMHYLERVFPIKCASQDQLSYYAEMLESWTEKQDEFIEQISSITFDETEGPLGELTQDEFKNTLGGKNDGERWLCDYLLGWSQSKLSSQDREDASDRHSYEPGIPQYFMGSSMGANMGFKILKQLIEERFAICLSASVFQHRMSGITRTEKGSGDVIDSSTKACDFNKLTLYYLILKRILDWDVEQIPDFLSEKGLKVANVLKVSSNDHMILGKLTERCLPRKLVELFASSHVGGLAVRSRMDSTKPYSCLDFAQALGAAIWPNFGEDTFVRPLENFFISMCQYQSLWTYASYMTKMLKGCSPNLRLMYMGISKLCSGSPTDAVEYFSLVSSESAARDKHFMKTVVGGYDPEQQLSEVEFRKKFRDYYIKVIEMFKIFNQPYCIHRIAKEAIESLDDDKEFKTMLCTLAFKCALEMKDYDAAYSHVLEMPSPESDLETEPSCQKLCALRTFVAKVVEHGEVSVLINTDFQKPFSHNSSIRELVEDMLLTHSNSSDPIAMDGPYQLLYIYHVSKERFHHAASTLYGRIIRIGEKGKGLSALQEQNQSYLDVITCLDLVDSEVCKYVFRPTGTSSAPSLPTDEPSCIECFDGDKIVEIKMESEIEIRSQEELMKEFLVCQGYLKLAEKVIVNPIRNGEFESKAKELSTLLANFHYYDDALEVATAWNMDAKFVVEALANSCLMTIHRHYPESGDLNEFIKHNDLSELRCTNQNPSELSLKLLQSFIEKVEKPMESAVHLSVALSFLGGYVELPQWLVDSYKKRNVGQLIHCYTKYGEYEKAVDLTIRVLDALLGKRSDTEFDPSVRKVSSYEPVEPVLPYHSIRFLFYQLDCRAKEDTQLADLFDLLDKSLNDFVNRVEQIKQERLEMFSSSLD